MGFLNGKPAIRANGVILYVVSVVLSTDRNCFANISVDAIYRLDDPEECVVSIVYFNKSNILVIDQITSYYQVKDSQSQLINGQMHIMMYKHPKLGYTWIYLDIIT